MNKRIKVLYIISRVEYAKAFEWIADAINQEVFDLSFLFLNEKEPPLARQLAGLGATVRTIPLSSGISRIRAFVHTCFIIRQIKPDVIHCHLYDAGIVGITAGWLLRVKKRIYTRHYSTIHHQYFPKGVKVDRWINGKATQIIAISENVRNVLEKKEDVFPEKITLIHHGFDLSSFSEVPSERVQAVRTKHSIENTYFPVVGVISRFTKWKGVDFIVDAFQGLVKKYPNALLVLANAQGEEADNIQIKLNELPDGSYVQIVHEADIQALYQLFDVFVHVPIDAEAEAFGQIYVEALAAGIPAVVTLSGVARSFIVDEENAKVVDFENALQIQQAIEWTMENSKEVEMMVRQAKEDVHKFFSLNEMITKLEQLYQNGQ